MLENASTAKDRLACEKARFCLAFSVNNSDDLNSAPIRLVINQVVGQRKFSDVRPKARRDDSSVRV